MTITALLVLVVVFLALLFASPFLIIAASRYFDWVERVLKGKKP